MALRAEPLSSNFGYVIHNQADEDLLRLHESDISRLFKAAGALVFRGFHMDLDRFKSFTEKFGAGFLVNGNSTREPVSDEGKTQTVNPGKHFIPPHAEMGYNPLRPEIVWFYYARPAQKNGETFLCDGIQVLSEMKPATRELFLNKRIKFTYRNIPSDFWMRFGCNTQDEISGLLSGLPTTTYRFNEDRSMYLEYVVSAVRTLEHSDKLAFCHSIHNQADLLHFEDGSEIPEPLRQEILFSALSVAVIPKWQVDDVIMIDNNRVMHGRKAFDDPERRVYVRIARNVNSVTE
jgi:alpha-ketoglutarate-dependent taurine dioxygenase